MPDIGMKVYLEGGPRHGSIIHTSRNITDIRVPILLPQEDGNVGAGLPEDIPLASSYGVAVYTIYDANIFGEAQARFNHYTDNNRRTILVRNKNGR